MAFDHRGKVKFFSEEKNFGFITLDNGESVFFHRSTLSNNVTVRKDTRVRCETAQAEKGLKATRVILD